MHRSQLGIMITIAGLLLMSQVAVSAEIDWQHKIQPEIQSRVHGGTTDFLVLLTDQADLAKALNLPTKNLKGLYTYQTLVAHATRTQTSLLEYLLAADVDHQAFWIVNLIWVQGDATVVANLAQRPEVARIVVNAAIGIEKSPPYEVNAAAKDGVEWNLDRVDVPLVWAEGIRGEGAVLGVMDTGFDWDHSALIGQYRGWNGVEANHAYNWHDAIHESGGICPPDSPEPCDDQGHGTHVLGIAVGDDGVNQIGVAPGARWIGCRCMSQGLGSVARYLECLEWMLAPTDLDDANPDPTLAPDILHNSWVCISFEGCTDPTIFRTAFLNLRRAGIALTAAAGNAGPNCGSIAEPPGIYEEVLTVGATNSLDQVVNFSGRGPATVDGSGRLKPDVVAPGLNIRSSFYFDNFHLQSGTSQAAPHVAGLLALLISANPALRGEVGLLETIVRDTCLPLPNGQNCGGLGGQVPNNVTGFGRIDAWAAYQQAMVTAVHDTETPAGQSLARLLPGQPNPFNPSLAISFELDQAALVELAIYDLTGRLVHRLLGPIQRSAGTHHTGWNGHDLQGKSAPAGVYLVRLMAADDVQVQRVTLVR